MAVRKFRLLPALFLISTAMSTATMGDDVGTPVDIFNERILPIFRSPNPSSCVQCHLASVDLKDYILPSSERTFVSLRDQGLVDLKQPAESKILSLIRMGERDADAGANLIHKKMRDAELVAFASWIEACCKDDRLRSLPASKVVARPVHPDAIIRHARKSRIVDSFVRNVWSQRMRCFPCHTPHEIDSANPKHKIAVKRQSEFAEKYNRGMLRRLHFFRKTPEETLGYLLSDSKKTPENRLPLINIEEPTKSLIVLKPTAKLPKRKADKTFERPSYLEPVSHMGGLKMHKDDQSYKSVLAWIRDYSNLTSGQYTSVKDLPADNWYPTQKVIRLRKIPEEWKVGTVFQLFVHVKGEVEPVAFTQGTVTPRQIVNGSLFLFGKPNRTTGSPPPVLEPGEYVVKVYADGDGNVAKDPAALLTDGDLIGSIKRTAKWRDTFKFAELIDATGLVAGGIGSPEQE